MLRQAISFGSTESVVGHRAGMERPDSPAPSDMLRVSVGLEHTVDLITDLKQANDAVQQNFLSARAPVITSNQTLMFVCLKRLNLPRANLTAAGRLLVGQVGQA